MKPIRWGILATGNIADTVASDLKEIKDAKMVAVASRNQAKADAFGKKWSIPRRYPNYQALVEDPDVDVVYITTPHSFHYENMLMCLQAGKHVLCEKAFTLNAAQAVECIALARQNNLFLMEAMWMRFNPAIKRVKEWVQDGLLGDIRLLLADFFLNLAYDPLNRLYNPELGGGALLDLGIYPLSFTTFMLGLPKSIDGHAHLSPDGVDVLDTYLLIYENGASAALACGVGLHKPREAFIAGNKGYIKVHDFFVRPDHLTLHLKGQRPQEFNLPYRGNGYVYEIEEVHACLRGGRTESTIMPLDETLELMSMMDRLRAAWGVVYPHELNAGGRPR
jgi:predicted dehydrogenase